MSGPDRVKTLLVIDDDRILCAAVKDYLTGKTVQVLAAHSGAEGLAVCSQRKVDVVLLDQKLPDVEGHTICPAILQSNEECKIIFITAHPSFTNALKAIQFGACEYLSKPFELEELRLAVEKAFRTLRLEKVEEVQNYKIDRESETKVLIGGRGALAETMRMVDLAAAVDSPVLITGETGTGKNLVAETIHFKGPNPRAAFIGINCAGLPENLMEAELFGYEKGAYTGAVTSRKGIFEMAEGGTLLLDEIGEIPLHLQSKLLSAVEEKKIRRLGSESIRPVEVRIIASTSVALESVLGSSFRKDLYYRLNVIRIHLPPPAGEKAGYPGTLRSFAEKNNRRSRSKACGRRGGKVAGLRVARQCERIEECSGAGPHPSEGPACSQPVGASPAGGRFGASRPARTLCGKQAKHADGTGEKPYPVCA